MTVSTSNTAVTMEIDGPRVSLPDGGIVGLTFNNQGTAFGTLFAPVICEMNPGGAGQFYYKFADTAALEEIDDPWTALADLLVESGFDPQFMTPNKAAYVKNWLSQQTFESAIRAIKTALMRLAARIAADFASAYPPSVPAGNTGAPPGPEELLDYWLKKYCVLTYDPATKAVTASFKPIT